MCVIDAAKIEFGDGCALACNRAWLDLADWRAWEVVIVIGAIGENGRAIVPRFTQCAHPWGSRKAPREVEVQCGGVTARVVPRTFTQYAYRDMSGGETHAQCSCFAPGK